MRRGALLVYLALGLAAPSLRGQSTVFVRDAGPGPAGRILRSALAGPHVLLRADTAGVLLLRRDTAYSSTVVVLGGDAAAGSRVTGDVIVVGGDLFLHPGAVIEGRAVAIGGGVYNSSLALVRGGRLSFRDFTFLAVPVATGLALDYRELARPPDVRLVSFPGFGLRLPLYDRVNGVSAPWGPLVSLDTGRYEVEPIVTYRSDLGALDASAAARARLSRTVSVEAWAGRGTFTNDAWIRGDAINSLLALVTGTDVRNYYRADRATVVARWRWQHETLELEPAVGATTERAWSVGPDSFAAGGPWSLLQRGDREDGMLRPNPPVERGRISSVLGGTTARWESEGVTVEGSGIVELPFATPRDERWVQTTLDASAAFPTFRDQRFAFEAHALLTSGGPAPPQRYSYLGGAGTLPTFRLLEFGGDQLFFAESRYIVPLEWVVIPVLGVPTFTLRHLIGSAGVGGLPSFEQNVGLRLEVALLRLDYTIDPASRETDLSLGLALFR